MRGREYIKGDISSHDIIYEWPPSNKYFQSKNSAIHITYVNCRIKYAQIAHANRPITINITNRNKQFT